MTDFFKEMQIDISENFWPKLSPESTPSDLKSYEPARRVSEIWFVPIRDEHGPSPFRSEWSASSDDASFTSNLTPFSPAKTTMCFMNTQRSDATCECDFTCESLAMNMLSLAISPSAFDESSSELECIFSDHASEHTEEDEVHEQGFVATPASKSKKHKSVFYADLSQEERCRLPKSNLYLYSITRESSGPEKEATIHQYWELCQEDGELCAISAATSPSLPSTTLGCVRQNLDSVATSVASEALEDEDDAVDALTLPVGFAPKKKSVTFVDGNSVHHPRRDFLCKRSREQFMQDARRAKRHVKRKKKNASESLRRHGDQLANSQKIIRRPGNRFVGEKTASDAVTTSNLDIERNALEKRMSTLRFYRSDGHLRSSSLESFNGSNKTENPLIKSANYKSHKSIGNTPCRIMKNTSSNPDFSLNVCGKAAQVKENAAKGSPTSKKYFEKFSRQSEELGQSGCSTLSEFGTLTPFERDSLDERLLEALLEQNALRRGRAPRVARNSLWSSYDRKVKPGNNTGNCGEGWRSGRGKSLPCRFQGRNFVSKHKSSSMDNHHSRTPVVKESPKQNRPDFSKSKPNTLREHSSLKKGFESELTLNHKMKKSTQFKPVASCKLLNFNRPKHTFWFDPPSQRNASPRNEASHKSAKLLRKAKSEPVLSHHAQPSRPSSSKKIKEKKCHVMLGEPTAEDGGKLCARSKQSVDRTRSNSAKAGKKSKHKPSSTGRDPRHNSRKHHCLNPQRSASFAHTKTCSGGGHKKRKAAPCSCVRHCPQLKMGTPGKAKSAHSCKLCQWSVSHSPLSEFPVRKKKIKERIPGKKGHVEIRSTRHKKDSKSGSKKKRKNGLSPTIKKSTDIRNCKSCLKIGKSKSLARSALVCRSSSDLLSARTHRNCAESPLAGTSRTLCETPKEDSTTGSKAAPRVAVDAWTSHKTPPPESLGGRRRVEKNEDAGTEERNIFSIIHGKLGTLINTLGTHSV